jgi:hypothetical protein
VETTLQFCFICGGLTSIAMVSCLICKGRLFCGLKKCPLLEKARFASSVRVGREISGESPPNAFIGWGGYPSVYAGPLISVCGTPANSPADLYGLGFDEIIAETEGMVRGMKRAKITDPESIGELRDAVMSVKTVQMEAKFVRPPSFKMSFSSVNQPMGPSAEIHRMRLTSNPKIPRKVDEFAEEKVKAREAMNELMGSGFEYYYLQKLLSAGLLGVKKKLVPTRWSITATDRIIGDDYIRELKDYPSVNEFTVYSNTYLYNHYEILLLPGPWEFEQFEAWWAGSLWAQGESKVAHEYEPYGGRSKYADEEGGGYYAGRMAVAEGLVNMRKQARAIVFREIYDGYRLPVGVWQVRESVRKAFEEKPEKFATRGEALASIASRLKRPMSQFLSRSVVLRQRKLIDF